MIPEAIHTSAPVRYPCRRLTHRRGINCNSLEACVTGFFCDETPRPAVLPRPLFAAVPHIEIVRERKRENRQVVSENPLLLMFHRQENRPRAPQRNLGTSRSVEGEAGGAGGDRVYDVDVVELIGIVTGYYTATPRPISRL